MAGVSLQSARRRVSAAGPVAPFHRRFYAPSVRLIVEVEGGYRAPRATADAPRGRKLACTGYRVQRVEVAEVRFVRALVASPWRRKLPCHTHRAKPARILKPHQGAAGPAIGRGEVELPHRRAEAGTPARDRELQRDVGRPRAPHGTHQAAVPQSSKLRAGATLALRRRPGPAATSLQGALQARAGVRGIDLRRRRRQRLTVRDRVASCGRDRKLARATGSFGFEQNSSCAIA